MYLYQRVSVNLQGNMLLPLNELKQVYDNLYQLHVKKYRDREGVLERRVLPLDCLWNDVLHLSPIHPHKIKKASIEQGLQLSNLGHYFRFEALNLGLDECNSTFFGQKSKSLVSGLLKKVITSSLMLLGSVRCQTCRQKLSVTMRNKYLSELALFSISEHRISYLKGA